MRGRNGQDRSLQTGKRKIRKGKVDVDIAQQDPRAIPHNSKCRYGERGAADAKPKAQIILDAAKVSAASGGNSEPKQEQRSQSARGFCPRSTMRVPQPDIIVHFGNADAVPQLPERCLSRKAGIVRCCPRQNKIGPCLGAAGADKFNDSNNSKMRKRKLYRSMGAVLAFSQVFSSSVRRGLSISYTWAWYAFSQLIWSRVSSSTMTGSVEMGTRVSGSNFSQ